MEAQDYTALYREARQKISENNCREATEILKKLSESDYILKDYALYDLAICYEKVEEKELLVEKLTEFIEKYKASPLLKFALKKLIAFKIQENMDDAEVLIDDYLANVTDEDDVAVTAIDIFIKNGKRQKAERLLKRLFLKGSEHIEYAYKKIKGLKLEVTEKEVLTALKKAFERKNYRKIIRIVENSDNLSPESQLLLGKAFFHTRNYSGAIRYLIDSPFREGRIIALNALLRIGDRVAADIMLKRLEKESEKGLYEIYLRLAQTKRRENVVNEAKAEFIRLLKQYPEKSGEILWEIAWSHILNKEYEEAKKYLKTALKDEKGENKDRIIYWLGKLEEREGRSGDPYYSLLKDSKSYYAAKLNLINLKKGDNQVDKTDNLSEKQKYAVLRADELKRLALDGFALWELRAVKNEINRTNLPVFAGRFYSLNDFRTVINIAERYGEFDEFSYPVAYDNILSDIARENRVDKFLALAVMREESRFDTEAVSVAGAIGLMQLMPETAFRYVRVERNEDLFKPYYNIYGGVKYLKKLLKDYKNVYHAVAAYNAGEHRVNKWLKREYRDDDEFVEDIPFGETRNYVKKVLRSYHIYKELYSVGGD